MEVRTTAVPSLDIDLFSEDSLQEPFAHYRLIRDAGPAVWLDRLDAFAIGRFYDVQSALRANDRLINGQGIGFSEVWNAGGGQSVLQMDGRQHTRLRRTIMRPLTPSRIKEVRSDLKQLVAKRIEALIGTGEFDAMQALAAFLPVEAISHLVGLPEVGRERMLDWAAATFNLIGPEPPQADIDVSAESREFMAKLSHANVREGSWAGELFAAVERERLSKLEAMQAISAYVIPSLDTTILAKGHLLHDVATNPDQWAALLRQPEKIPSAVSESVRRNSVLRFFGRVAAQDYDVDGTVVRKGTRVMLLYGCANRDERRYPEPDRFDIARDARDQLAWGTGSHMCLGMHLARLEMEVLLEALVERDVDLWCGTPEVGVNRGLFGYTRLPYRLDTKGGNCRDRR